MIYHNEANDVISMAVRLAAEFRTEGTPHSQRLFLKREEGNKRKLSEKA